MVLAKALAAPRPRSKTAMRIAWVYAAILVVMLVGQLFAFEKFIPLMQDYWLPGGYGTTVLIASGVVTAEVFALPYLLRMPLSPLMRWCSRALAIIVPIVWSALALRVFVIGSVLANGGMLGTKVPVSPLLQLIGSLALFVFAVVVVWGFRPTIKK